MQLEIQYNTQTFKERVCRWNLVRFFQFGTKSLLALELSVSQEYSISSIPTNKYNLVQFNKCNLVEKLKGSVGFWSTLVD